MSLRGLIRGEQADLLRPKCVLICLCRSVQELAAALAKLPYLAAKMDGCKFLHICQLVPFAVLQGLFALGGLAS